MIKYDGNIPPEIVDKIDVATRQLKESILLFFEKRDIVVVHCTICAAHQILYDIASEKDIHSKLKNTELIPKNKFRKHVSKMNYPYNFFKHADKDKDGKINISPLPEFTSEFIMDAILMHQNLTNNIPTEAKMYWHWYVSYFEEYFTDQPENGLIKEMIKWNIGKVPFEEILFQLKAELYRDSLAKSK